jgi:hypothetical protein
MLSVFVGLLCGLLSMLRALLGTRREFVLSVSSTHRP